ncbi:MAG: hypothetical protein ABIW38_08435 [Ferruginibacter sp.]
MKTWLKNILLLCCLPMVACAQTQPVAKSTAPSPAEASAGFILEKFIPGSFSYLDADVLDNIYLITETNQLRKLNSNGDSIASYNDVKKYGNPSLIDVSNPMKILVYYRNFSTVVMLDRLLTFRNSINLRKLNIFSVKALSISYDNNTWVFDEQDYKLKKISDEGKLLQESSDWRIIMDAVPSPTQIIDRDKFVYLYDSSKGFYVFDYYGSFKNNIPLFNWHNSTISKNRIMGFANDSLLLYDLTINRQSSYLLPGILKNCLSIKAINSKLYALKNEGLEIYRIK